MSLTERSTSRIRRPTVRMQAFTDEERGKFGKLLDAGFIDTFSLFSIRMQRASIPGGHIGSVPEQRNAGWEN